MTKDPPDLIVVRYLKYIAISCGDVEREPRAKTEGRATVRFLTNKISSICVRSNYLRVGEWSQMNAWRVFMACGILLVAIGCARIDVKTLSAADDSSDDGIRYYERAPFLLVYSDGKGGVVTHVQYLPDRTRLRSVHPFNFLASNKNTLTFKNGMLSTSTNTSDASALPSAIIKAVETVAAAAAKYGFFMVPAVKEGYVLPPPALYRIHINNGQVTFVGQSGTDPDGNAMVIQFTLQTQEKAEK